MKLTIEYFRCYGHPPKVLKLTEGMTCFRGPSGSGKSTVFAALLWVLYGKERNVVPHETKGRTSVTLEFGDYLVIVRKKKPEWLQVTLNGQVYLDDVGQALLDQLFLRYELFRCVAVANRRDHNAFLNLAQSDRSRILEMLAGEDHLEEKYTKLDEAIKVKTKTLQQFDKDIEIIQGIIQTFAQDIVLPEDPDPSNRLVELQTRRVIFEKEWQKYHQRLAQQQHLTKELEQIQRELAQIPVDLTSRIDQLQTEKAWAEVYPRWVDLRNQLASLDERLVDIDRLNLPEFIDVTSAEIDKAQWYEQQLNIYQDALKRKNVANLEAELEELRQIFDRKDHYTVLFQRQELQRKIKDYPPTELVKAMVDQMKKDNFAGELLTCPQCQAQVCLKNGYLIIGTGSKVDPEDLIKADKLLQLCLERDIHARSLEALPVPPSDLPPP